MRKAGVALSALALALTLGACGGNSTDGTATSIETQGTSGNAPAGAANLVDLARSIGEETAEANTAHMTMTATAAGQDISGEGDMKFGTSDAAMSLALTTPEGAVAMMLVDGVLYMKLPQELEPGKPWIKITPESNSAMAQALSGINEQLGKNADPRAALKMFEKSGEITDSKQEELNGETVTHYTITVDVRKLADQQTDPTQKKALQDAIAAGLKDFPVDLYVNEDGLPVRIATVMPTPDGSGGTTEVKMQVDYTRWGEPVDITAPPADQTMEPPA